MIKLKRRKSHNGFNYDFDYYVRKEAIIGVYDIGRSETFIVLVSGVEVEVKNKADEILKLLAE